MINTMAGLAIIRVTEARVLISVTSGAADKRYRGNTFKMAGKATVCLMQQN